MTRSPGNETMVALSESIHAGAMAFLKAEYKILVPFVFLVALLLAFAVDIRTAAAFVAGAACSIAAGLFGMEAATRANVRTSEAGPRRRPGPGASRRVPGAGQSWDSPWLRLGSSESASCSWWPGAA